MMLYAFANLRLEIDSKIYVYDVIHDGPFLKLFDKVSLNIVL